MHPPHEALTLPEDSWPPKWREWLKEQHDAWEAEKSREERLVPEWMIP